MKLIINSFYQEKSRLETKEKLLQEGITERKKLIVDNEKKYKEYLRTGKEDKADKLFEGQEALKQKNISDAKKLSELLPIHKEFLQEKALEVLDNDLIPLIEEQTVEALTIVQEEKNLHDRLEELRLDRMRKEREINGLFGKYEQLTEKMKLKEKYRGRFGRDPYSILSSPGSKIFTAAQKRMKQLEGK